MEQITNNNIDELTLMRGQMEELKLKLDREIKVNENSIRKLQKRNAGFINKYLIFAWAAIPVIALMFIAFKYAFGLSWMVTIFIILGCLIDVYFDTRFNRMKNADIEQMSLIDMSERLLWMKRMRRNQFLIELPFLIIWAVWFIIELYNGIDRGLGFQPADHLMATIICACTGFGAIVGGIIGYLIYRKMQHDSDDVIEQIRSLKE